MRVHNSWKTCKACDLRPHPRVFFRASPGAKKPIDVLFVGEAPGETEVLLGEPFTGASGRLLQMAINKVGRHKQFSYVMVNAVICTPYIEDDPRQEILGKPPIGKPTTKQVNACSFHLTDTINRFLPRNIVALGSVAQASLKRLKVEYHALRHPNFVLGKGGIGSLQGKKFILQLRDILNGKTKT